MIEIDGASGEGGGQILRTSLTLAVMTQKRFRISNIRAKRTKPGLRAQHLKAVEAAATISAANVEGNKMGSTRLFFEPQSISPGNYRFDIGTAGSTSLVLQTIFPPLSTLKATSRVTIIGGTHVPWSPSYPYLELNWLHWMNNMGFNGELSIDRAGYYPRGGGCIQASIQPADQIRPVIRDKRGELRRITGISTVSNLPASIAKRQKQQSLNRLDEYAVDIDIQVGRVPSPGKGSAITLVADFDHTRVCYSGLGARGKPAERVADEATLALIAFLESDANVDEYLADQLLLPLSFAQGVSHIQTPRVTKHLQTNAQIIRAFLPGKINIHGKLDEFGQIEIIPAKSNII